MIRLCWLTLLFCANCSSYTSENLPISETLADSFPELNARCFIIANEDTRTVIHEQNSRHRIQISDSKSKESLYDLICSTHKALEKSKISGMTVVFTYTNKHGSSFTIALSGLNNIDDLESDKGKITRWLDQFFKIVVYRKGNCIEKLPVIFGGDIKTINMTADREIAVILSDKQINQITKRVVYKALVQTPVYITTELGRVSLHTPTFRNHVVFHINSRENIKDGPKLSIVLDSIKYLIFGANYAGVN